MNYEWGGGRLHHGQLLRANGMFIARFVLAQRLRAQKRRGTPNRQRCPSGLPRSPWPDTGGLLDLTLAPQRILPSPAAPPLADCSLPPRAWSSRWAESRTARFSGPVQSHLPGSPSLRLAQGVLWGHHAASRPLGRRAGTQHGRQKRSIQADSAGGVKNRSNFSLEFNSCIYYMHR